MKRSILAAYFILLFGLLLSPLFQKDAKALPSDPRKGLTMCVTVNGTIYACLENASTWDCGGTPPCE